MKTFKIFKYEDGEFKSETEMEAPSSSEVADTVRENVYARLIHGNPEIAEEYIKAEAGIRHEIGKSTTFNIHASVVDYKNERFSRCCYSFTVVEIG